MSKNALKKQLGAKGDPSLIDTHRVVQKAVGGTYKKPNVRLMKPRAHMKRHGTLRIRTVVLDDIKAVLDDRAQTMKLKLKVNNQLLAYKRRTDHQHAATTAFLVESLAPILARLKEIDASLKTLVTEYEKVDAVTAAVLTVPFVGPVTAAMLAAYVDLKIADTASSLWAYVGLDRPAHERYELKPGQDPRKGRGGNQTLRTALYVMATVMWKSAGVEGKKNKKGVILHQSAYRLVGDRVKARLAASKNMTMTRNTQGKLVSAAWKDVKPGHRQGAAMRAMIKHFLADYWFVGREILGLPTRALYVQSQLGHTGIVQPQERGWKW